MQDATPVDTPFEPHSVLLPADVPTNALLVIQDKHKFMSIVGGLMYLAVHGLPEIQFAVNQVAAYMHAPGQLHMTAAKRIVRFLIKVLQNPTGGCITYCHLPSTSQVSGLRFFADASWGGATAEDAKSISGSLALYNGCPIAWFSRRQQSVALSSAESEYVSLAETVKAAKYLLAICDFFQLPIARPVTVFSDSQSAIHLASNPVTSQRTRHINIRYHFIRDEILSNEFKIIFVKSDQQLADILTKGLPRPQFQALANELYGQRK